MEGYVGLGGIRGKGIKLKGVGKDREKRSKELKGAGRG